MSRYMHRSVTRKAVIRTLLADDHPVVRIGLRALQRLDSSIAVVGEAGTAAEALALVKKLLPDVVLLDMSLPDGSGAVVCAQIKACSAKTRVLVLSGYADVKYVVSAIHAGADGYLLKGASLSQVVEGIHAVIQGGACFDSAVTRHILDHVQTGIPASPLSELTLREENVLAQVAKGKTDKEVATILNLKPKAVRNRLDHCFKKLNVNTRTSAALVYVRYQGGALTVRSTYQRPD